MLLTSWLQGFWNQFNRKSSRRIKGRKLTQARRKPISGKPIVERLEDRVVLDSTYHSLAAGPLVQDWSNSAQVSADNDWSGVPSIEGYLGDGLSAAPGADPQTITSGAATTLNVFADETDPSTVTGGGVAEFEIADPTIALQGSDSAQAPYLLFHVDTTGRSNVTMKYVLRDIDGTATDTVQPFALQYRIGNTDPFINIPAAFVSDATDTGDTKTTTVNVVLPSGADNQTEVQIRLITANAAGSADDEWVGIDDIEISSQPLLTLPTAPATYTENGSGTAIDAAATVDNVTSSLEAGTLVASITANGQGTDVLSVLNIGTGAGQIGVSGSNVTYEGVTLGSLSGGTGGTPLTVTLNASATPAKAQALLRAIAFSSTSNNPSTTDRTISFVLTDGDGNASPSATQTMHVLSVNDAPSFTKGADQTVLEDSGASSISNWATGISAGADEGSQTVHFALAASDPAFFSVQPAVSPTGTLTFTPAANANGSATIFIRLFDDGGTANGGVDASPIDTFVINITAVNDVPSFTSADVTALEDSGAQSVSNWATNISKGPADEAGQSLTFNITDNSNPGLFSVGPAVAADGTLTYTLAPNANGFADITLTLSDNGGTANGGVDTSAPQTFRINATAVNDPPSFVKGADQTVLEDASAQSVSNWATSISAGPADEAGQALTFNITNNSNSALFSVAPAISAAGTLTYTLAPDANGFADITVTLSDDGGTANSGVDTSAPQTFRITATAVNDAPSFTKGADETTLEDSGAHSVSGWATALSTGPADEAGQTLTFNVTGNTNAGLFSVAPAIAADGTLTYTLAADANGSADITVTLSDDGGTADGGADTSASQTFKITVTAVNDAPSFTKGADQTVLEDSNAHTVANWATAISAGPADEAGQALTFNVTGNTNATLFSVAPAIAADGTLTYTLAADANGSADITITLSDDGGTADGGVDTSASQTFTINITAVNDVPSFTKGADETAGEDTGAHTVAGWATAISAGPADEAGQTLTFNVTGNTNPGLFAVAPAVAADGTLTYTLAANAVGASTITITLSDNGGTANGGVDTSAPQTFTITVTAVNDRPTFTGGPDQTVNEDSGAQSVANWATAISAGPADEAGQSVNFLVSNDNNGLFSSQPAISATGTLTYTPAANAFGTATVTVVLQDNGGTANGGNDTSTSVQFTITVLSVNDAPSFTPGANQTVNEDAGAVTVANWATNISAGPANESSQALTFLVANDNNGLFAVQPAIAADGTLTFTPAADLFGSATVTVVLTDNGGTANGGINSTAAITFQITVQSVNDTPSFTKGADETVLEDTGAHSVPNWATNITDGPADEAGQTLTFNVTNDNNALFSVQPAVAADGTLTYTLAPNAFGAAVVTVTLSDDGGTANGGADTSASQTFNITVTGINDAPSFTVGGDQTVLEDAAPQSVANWATNISAGPSNESAQVLTFNVTGNTNTALFAAGPAIAADGTLTYTLAANANGFADITIVLMDDGGTTDGGVDTSAPATFRISATAVNDAPTFTVPADATVLEDAAAQSVANFVTNISAGAADEAGQVLTFNVTGNTNTALFSVQPAIAADGTLTYTLAAGANGFADITITLSDDGGTADGGVDTSAPVTFRITATAVNDAPSFTKGADQTVLEDAAAQSVANWATNISAGPADEAGQTLSFNVTGNTNTALFSVQPAIAADGTLTYTLAADANGSATITITLSDNGGTADSGVDTSAPQTFDINITAVNDAPSFVVGPDQANTENDPPVSVSNFATAISAGPANEAGQTLTFNVTNDNSALFAVQPAIAADGTLTYTLAADAVGAALVTVTLSDNGGTADGGVDTSAPQTFNITVASINDAPSFTKGGDETVLEDSGAHSVANWATNISAGPADEAGQTLTFNVTGNTNPALFAAGPAIAADGTLTYTLAADANGFADITIVLMDDGGTANGGFDTSAPQTFRINVTAVNDAPSFTKGADETVLEDTGAHSIANWATAISAGPADEAGQTLTFNLTGNTNLALFSVQPAVAADGTLTYTLAANANGSADVTFTLSDDGGTADGGSDTSAAQTFKITVTAVNDAPSFTGGADESVLEDTGGHTVPNWATAISKGPANESGQALTFLVSNDNNALFSVQPAISATGTLTYTLAPNANGSATVSVVLQDNGGTANGGNNTSGLDQFTISVTAVNDAPTFAPGADQTVDEDSGAASVTGWATNISAGPADEAAQTLTFLVTNDNNALFSAQPAIAADGTLTFTPAANANGSATVTVILSDDGGTADGGDDTSSSITFTITVQSVNDAPSFTKGADEAVLEDSGAHIVPNWATNISAGPANESSQTLTFNVTNDNNALFAVQPAIAADGTLTYTLAADAFGTAVVTVTLSDNGGTANGGVDTSASQTFNIVVTGINDAPSYTIGADQSVLEDDPAQSVANWATNISAGPANESTQVLAFNVTNNSNPALFSVAPAIAADGTLTYTLAADANGFADITIVLVDDGGTADGGVDSTAPLTFRITAAAVNDAPSFTVGPDQSVLDDVPPQSIFPWATNISAGPADEAGQNLTFVVTNNTNPGLFSAGPSVAADGTLTYTLVPNSDGFADLTIVLTDDGGTANGGVDTSAPQTFRISVNLVNDAPSFTKGGDETVLEDSGAHSVANWATNISAGPANEAGQTLTFIVTNNTNTSLFSAGPAIAADGTLTYTLAADANGFADITVVLMDDGGTANGGVDTSAPQTFRINVTAVNDAPTFTKGADESVLEDSGAHSVANWATAISAGPADEAGQTVAFNVTGNTNSALFSVQPAVAADGTLTYTLAANANGVADITITLSDDGGTANGGSDTSGAQTFQITVGAINDAPSFTGGADQSVAEDAGAQSVLNWATAIIKGPANESGQTLTFLASNDNNALFSTQPAISAAGTLTYTPTANAHGTATVTVVLQDNGGTANGGVDTSTAYTFTITVLSVNDAPSFTAGADQTVDEDSGAASIAWATNSSAGPTDEAGQTLTFVVGNDNNALFSVQPAIAADGTLTFTPAADANGSAVVTVILTDNGGTANGGVNSTPAITFTITVRSVNDVPSFTKGADESVLEDSGAHTVANWATNISAGPANESTQTVAFNVTNDNNALFAVQPAIAADGTLTYTLAADAFGTAVVTVTLSDNGGTANGGVDTSAPQTFNIVVNGINDVPSFTVGADQALLEDDPAQSVANWATNISAGPANEAAQVLTFNVTGNTNPALFAAGPAIAADGTLTYTLAANANGSATITITLSDNGGTADGGVDTTAPQSFTISVTAVNDAPTFTVGPDQNIFDDATLQTVPNWATNISAGPADEAGQTVVFNVVNNSNPAIFSVQPSIAPDGTLTYQLVLGADDFADITITLSDNGGTANGGADTSAPQTFRINALSVNDAPTFTVGPDQTVLEDAAAQSVANWATNIDAGAPNEGGQTLTFIVTNNTNTALFSAGPAVAADGTLTYTLAPNANGFADITIVLMDDGGTVNGGVDTSAPQTFRINVTAVNDAPSFTPGADESVLEDSGAHSVANWAAGISAGPADEAGQALAFNVTGNTNLALFSVQPAIAADGTLTYTLAADAFGFADITITLSDNGGTANGGVDTSAPQTFRITAGAVNDGPTFTGGADQTVLEDSGAHSVANWATAISAGPANESAQTLSFLVSNDNNGLFSVQPVVASNGTLTFTPAANANGSATVTVVLQDNGGTANGGVNTSLAYTFTISVTAVNDAPSFTPGADQTVDEDAGAQTVAGWATNISGGPADEAGQTVTFLLSNDNNALFAVQPAIAADGTLTYTPTAEAFGTATVTVVLTDNGGTANGGVNSSSAATFTITVRSVNDVPSFTKGGDETVLEDTGAHTVANWATNISAGPANESAQTLTFNVTNDNNGLFAVQPAIAADGTLTYTLAADAFGTGTVTVTLSDDGGTANGGVDTSAAQTFTITVTGINDVPSFTVGPDQNVLDDVPPQSIAGWATNISAGPANEAGQTLTFIVTNNTNPALFAAGPAVAADGTLTYTLVQDADGFADITIVLMDNGGTADGGVDTSAPQTFRIVVTLVNDAPSFTGGPDQTVLEDAGLQTVANWATNISAGPANEAGQVLTFEVTNNTNPAFFSVLPSIAADGTLTYAVGADNNGFADITIVLKDNGGTVNGGVDTSTPYTFRINVTPVNDQPSFTGGADQTALEDSGAHSIPNWATNISAGPANEGGQALTFLVSNDNTSLFSSQPAISATGTLTYTPAANAHGTATVTVVLQDDGGTSDGGVNTSSAYTFTITILSVNDAPSFTPGGDQTVDEDAGDITVSPWATNISAGPANEASQTLAFVVSNNNNALFATQPSIAPDGTLTFRPADNAFGTATVTVALTDNGSTANGGQNSTLAVTFTITVLSVNDQPTFTPGADENVNEDSGAHTVDPWATNISAGPTNEAGQVLTFNVTNDNNALFAVQPAIDATGKLTYTLAPDAFGTANVTITLSDDGGTANGGVDSSAPHTLVITATSINDVPTYTIGSDQNVLEDDPAQSVANWATNITAGAANESSQVLTFNVTGNTNPGLFSVAPAIAADGTLTYTLAPDAFGSADITITLSDDGGTANGGVDTTAPQTFRITAAPVNDAPSFTPGPNQAVSEDAPAQTVPNWATNISAGPANESTQTLTFIVTNDNNILFSAQPAIAADGTLTYTPTANAFGVATVTVTLMDNGGTANGGVDTSSTITFTITVGEVNDAPTFTKGPDETVLEDSGAHTVPNWATSISAGPANEAGQTLTFTTSNNNNSLFSVQPTVALDGTLTYTLAANAFGVATVTVTLSDNGGTANGGVDSSTQTFTITVLAVNDVPTFTKGSDQNVLEDAVPQVVPNWATGISSGPANEAGQTLTFNVVNNTNPGLFSVAPAISAAGTLTYTLAPNANGFADITITLSDDGGTANGGVDTTAPQTFRINVAAVNDRPTFTVGPNLTVLEDAPPQTVPAFITNISAGPADEAGQTLSFLVSNNNNGLFSAQPTIAPNGTLSYTLAANAVGSATVTVILQDNGGTANGGFNTSLSQTFTISVTAVNDAPSFTGGPNQTVLEDAGPITVAGWATNIVAGPADEAGQILTFQVTNDNNSLFSAQPAIAANGTLTYTPAPNANGTATVTVVLLDNGGTANGGADVSSSYSFTITVTAVNDAPSFNKGSDQTVFEDAAPQTVLNWATSISAGPADEAGQALTFAVSNDNNGLFSVQPSISANGTLTYTPAANANGSATVTVTLNDNGGTANGGVDVSTTQTFIITVTAVDDPPTDLSLSNTTLPENSPIGTLVGTFSTTDPDVGDTFTYTLVAGAGSADNGSFQIVGNQLQTNTPLDFETKASYTVRVRTTSNGGAFFEKEFTITVTNVNEAPTDVILSSSTVAENQPVGTTIGTLSAVDPDVGDTFSYLLVNGAGSTDNASFQIVGDVLQTNAVLDFEAQPSYSIRVRTTDASGLSFEKILIITATNVNEAPTDVALSNSSVAENQPVGTTVGNFITTDQDAGDSFTYTLVAGAGSTDNGKFQVVGGSLQTNAVLDFEAQPTYSIRVNVTDAGGLSFEKVLTVTATNVNETPTNVTVTPSTVAENQPVGTTVGNFTTTDPDAGDSFTYTLVAGAGSTDNALFQIAGGTLQTNAVLDFEAQSTYSVRVRTTDADGLSFEKALTITVTDVNEAPTDLALSATTVAENQPIGTTVGNFITTDPDAGNTFTYTLVTGIGSTDNTRFQIFGDTLQTAAVLDFEAQAAYSIRVRTTDGGGLTFEKTFIITATNVQEAPSDVALSNSTVAENQPVGTAVGTLSSTDQDAGETFTYSLVPGVGSTDNALFQISGDTLQTNSTFNFELQGTYTVRVRTTDSAGLTFEKSFVISITNVNEAPTDLALAPSTIAENQPVGTVIGNFTTTDPDAGGSFTYTLVPGAGSTDNALFQIVSGALRTNAALNFEAQPTYSIRVRTTDAGGLSFEKTFTINVTNVNEVPTNIVLSSNTVPENQPVGTTIGTLTTTDPDAGDTFTYALVPGAGSIDNALFRIVGDALQTNAVLNFETQPSYSVRIRTTDALGLTFEKSFTILATNVNEAPTNITLNPNVLAESQPIGTVVGNLVTTDTDAGDTFTYSLIAGAGSTDNAKFQIVGGVVQTNAVLNFEAQASYSIRVRSTDAGGLSTEKTLLISVTNVNEPPTVITLSSNSVPENQPINTVVGTLSSNDPDFGDIVTFSLVGGAGATDNGLFQVVGNVVRTNSIFNFETQSSYSIRVRAVDSANHTFEQVLTIQITNVNEVPTNLALTNTLIAENQPIGTTVGSFSSTDPDQGDTFTYSLVSGVGSTDNGKFQIVGDTLLTNAVLNFEAQPTYSIRVRTTDAGGLTLERTFNITATNVNEAPVAVALTATAVSENRAVGTLVGLLTTTDPDAGSTFTYTLVNGVGSTGNASFQIVGDQLQTNAVLDFETQPTYSIRVRSTDAGGLSVEQVFTITVTNELDPPVVTTTAGPTTSATPKDVIIDAGVTVQDQDTTDFNGGRAEISIVDGVQNPDQLRIVKSGKGADRLKVAAGKLKLGKQVIGTVVGGTVGIPMQIFFTASTPTSLLERVLRSVALKTKANALGSRLVQFRVVDGDGQTSQPATKQVVIG